jgi:cellulose synthase (UDP-forming)
VLDVSGVGRTLVSQSGEGPKKRNNYSLDHGLAFPHNLLLFFATRASSFGRKPQPLMRESVSHSFQAIRMNWSARRQTKTIQSLLAGGLGIIVVYPILRLTALEWSSGLYIGLAALSRLAVFFCWFQLAGYWYFRFRSRLERKTSSRFPEELRTTPPVAILIPIRNEPITVIRRMFVHLQQIQYSPLSIVVVDNSSLPQHEALTNLAQELAVPSLTVVRKPTCRGFKAGALNQALSTLGTDVRYALVLDIDHAPGPQILHALVPHLEADPALAFVQAPQVYETQGKSLVGSAFCFKQRVFYAHICPGLSAAGCMFMSGSNTLIRLTALRDVGGFDESSLTEDLRTTLRLHSRGWKGLYTPQVVATGYAPMNFAGYHKQLRRWAIGTFQNWRAAASLLLESPSSLSTEQWLFYIGWNGLFYLQGIVVYLLVIVSAALLYVQPAALAPILDSSLAIGLLVTVAATWIHERNACGTRMVMIGASSALFYGDLAIMVTAFADLLLKRRIVFEVTPKAQTRYGGPTSWFVVFHLLMPFLLMLGALRAGSFGSWLSGPAGTLWPAMLLVQSGVIGIIGMAARLSRNDHGAQSA